MTYAITTRDCTVVTADAVQWKIMRLIGMLLVFWLVFCSYAQAGSSSATSQQGVPNDIFKYLESPMEALRIPEVSNAYKKAFGPYLGLKWIASPVVGTAKKSSDPILGDLVIYDICRPHACDTDRIIFIYNPANGRAWGKVRIISDINGYAANPNVEHLFEKFFGDKE